MEVTGDKGEDAGERITENKSNPCGQSRKLASELVSSRLGTRVGRATSRRTEPCAPGRLRAASRGPSSPVAARQRPPRGRGDSRGAGPGRCRPADTHLPGPRRGHDEVITRCSAPRRPAARPAGPCRRPAAGSRPATRDVEAGRRRIPLPFPARFPIPAGRVRRAEVRRGPSRIGGGGAGAVVRAWPRRRGETAVPGPGLGLRTWVWVRACVSERVSHGLRPSASPTGSRSGEAAGQARRAAILETGTGRGSGAGLRGAGRGSGHRPLPCRHLGSPPVRPSAPELFGPVLVPLSEAHGSKRQTGRVNITNPTCH